MQWLRDRQINSGAMQPISRKWIGKHVSMAKNMHATIELLLETLFSTQYVQRGYKEDSWGDPVSWKLSSAWEAVKIGHENRCWRISVAESCYQA
jgi:hypothetical protein